MTQATKIQEYTSQGIVLDFSALNMSEEQFLAFCETNKELRIERNENQKLSIMPPTGFNTGKRNARITCRLGLWNIEKELGDVGDSSTGYTLPDGSLRSPDASWVSAERLQTISPEDTKKFLPLCPDFVIELKSPSDSLPVLQGKMLEWIKNGCQLAWLIDCEKEKVYIYRQDGSIDTISSFDETVSGENILPDFVLFLSELRLSPNQKK